MSARWYKYTRNMQASGSTHGVFVDLDEYLSKSGVLGVGKIRWLQKRFEKAILGWPRDTLRKT